MTPTAQLPARRLATAAGWAVFALVAALLVVQLGAAAWHRELGDSDNFMRLAEVRDWLGGQSWWDMRQHRTDPGGGGLLSHWSRLADLPLAATIMAFRAFAGPDVAERLALVVQPLLLLGVALWLQGRIAVALAGPAAMLPAVVVGALSVPMLVQFVPGRIDHHGLQIVLVLAAMAALVRASGWQGAVVAAAACALSLNIGLEAAPYLVVLTGFVALRWAVEGEAARRTTLGFALGLAVAVPLLFALTIAPTDWPMPKGDAVGRGHVLLALAGGLGLAVAAWFARTRRSRWLGLAALSVGMLILLRLAAPEVVAEPYRSVGPLLWRLWIANIIETRSILDTWARSPVEAVGRMFFVAVCAILALADAWRGPRRNGAALLVAATSVAALLLAGWETRSLALATAVTVPVAGAWLGRLWSSPGRSARPLFAVGLLLLSHTPDNLLAKAGASATATAATGTPCATPRGLAELAQQPPGLVLSPIDLGGPILALTPHAVTSAPTHRDVHGNGLAYAVLLADPEAARRLLSGSGVTYLAWCPGSPENRILTTEAPDGLLARLIRGEPIGWLTPIGGPHAGPRLYLVG